MNNNQPYHKQPIIFCDFDGTITESDNVVQLVEHFKPVGWEQTIQAIATKTISIKDGIQALFSSFSVSQKQDIIDYVLNLAAIRPGFQQLLNYCQENNIAFYVTSGGIDFILEPILSPFDLEPEHIYCNHSDFSEETIRITCPYPCDAECNHDCGMCKSTIIRSFPAEQYTRIMIGDSITDFVGAKFCDMIFARSYLIDECERTGMSYFPFESFHDVVDQLKQVVIPS